MSLLRVIITLILIIAAQVSNTWAADFSFSDHWHFPLSSQGSPPESFSDLEASLNPDDCGSCHEKQWAEWETSRHSRAMGAGITGQLHPPWLDEDAILSCTNCHAPLAEQSPLIRGSDESLTKNPNYSSELRYRGITCAGCHVRRHVRYGPKPLAEKVEDPPHNSFTEVENFGASEFCKPCHQFQAMDRRVNGKLLQNTYQEWRNSPYFEKGVQCSNCHMPERRHLWQGIHNLEMVKNGLTIQVTPKGSKVLLEIVNSGVGHNFPTYITPKIVIRGSIIDETGKELPQTVQEKFIGRDVSLDLSEERYDNRIAPRKAFKAQFNFDPSIIGGRFQVTVRIYPDYFYSRFYQALLKNPPEGVDLGIIRKALEESRKSVYTLFEQSWSVDNSRLKTEPFEGYGNSKVTTLESG